MVKVPYSDKNDVRIFEASVDPLELKWHYDEQDRTVTALNNSSWKVQYDNELPVQLMQDVPIFIKAGNYHRLIKGEGSLRVKIVKHEAK